MGSSNKEFKEYKLNKIKQMLVDAGQEGLSKTVRIVLASDANAAIPTEVVVAWKLTERMLEELGVEYLLIGALAMNEFRHPRYTDDVDVVISPESLPRLMAVDVTKYGFALLTKNDSFIQLQELKYRVKVDVYVSGTETGSNKVPMPKLSELGKAGRLSAFGMFRLKLASFRLGRDMDDLATLFMKYEKQFAKKLSLLPEALIERYYDVKRVHEDFEKLR